MECVFNAKPQLKTPVHHVAEWYMLPHCITPLLAGCFNLRKLSIFQSTTSGPWLSGDEVVRHLIRPLSRSTSTLEVLILDLVTKVRPINLGILPKFKRLKKLQLSAEMILCPPRTPVGGQSIHELPESLRILEIDVGRGKQSQWRLHPALLKYVEDDQLSRSHTELTILNKQSASRDSKLARACERRGITLG